VRLFLALELPAASRTELDALSRRLATSFRDWKWVPTDNLHLTLRFLGEVDAERDRAARPAWRRTAAAARPVRLRLRGLGSFPGRRRPSVLWVGLEEQGPAAGGLPHLAQALELAARAQGFAPQERAFRPHLTLARGTPHGRQVAPSEPFESEHPFEVREVVLFQSRLGPGGAKYTALERYALG
jgi:2'-5' RNA ligase